MEEIILNVKGMMCNSCENRIKNVVGKLDGVQNVTADYTSGKVTIIADKTLKTKIEETINDIGYEVI